MKYKYPQYSDYMILAETVGEQDFSREAIARWFKRLVPHTDYSSVSPASLTKQLYRLSKPKIEAKLKKLRGLKGKVE